MAYVFIRIFWFSFSLKNRLPLGIEWLAFSRPTSIRLDEGLLLSSLDYLLYLQSFLFLRLGCLRQKRSFLLKLIQWRGSIYWMNWFHRVCFFAIRGTWCSLCCFSRVDSVYLLERFLDDLNLGLVRIIFHSGSCLSWLPGWLIAQRIKW